MFFHNHRVCMMAHLRVQKNVVGKCAFFDKDTDTPSTPVPHPMGVGKKPSLGLKANVNSVYKKSPPYIFFSLLDVCGLKIAPNEVN